jgi:hypothetical protein
MQPGSKIKATEASGFTGRRQKRETGNLETEKAHCKHQISSYTALNCPATLLMSVWHAPGAQRFGLGEEAPECASAP